MDMFDKLCDFRTDTIVGEEISAEQNAFGGEAPTEKARVWGG